MKKRVKGEREMVECSSGTRSTETEKNCKDSGAKKSEYIHVRARRGQATDSHSLAERVKKSPNLNFAWEKSIPKFLISSSVICFFGPF